MEQESGKGPEHDSLIVALRRDYRKAPLDAAERTMLEYAAKLTREPRTVGPKDVEALRRAEFDDRSIHDICCITAYFAFVNRVAGGLGVELEPRFEDRTRAPET